MRSRLHTHRIREACLFLFPCIRAQSRTSSQFRTPVVYATIIPGAIWQQIRTQIRIEVGNTYLNENRSRHGRAVRISACSSIARSRARVYLTSKSRKEAAVSFATISFMRYATYSSDDGHSVRTVFARGITDARLARQSL